MMEFNNTINLKEDEENEFPKENNSEDGKIKKIENINNYNNNNYNDGSNNNFIKKKRKRKHKK